MRRRGLSFRLAASVSAGALAVGLVAQPAVAQTAPPPPAAAAPSAPAPGSPPPATGDAATDPPAVVGQIAALNGTVSFHGPGVPTWSAATLNYPVSNGDGLWTEPGASATVAIGASQIMMSDSTEFEVDTLDQKALVTTQPQGELFLDVVSPLPGQSFTVRTPRGTVTMSGAGQVEIAAGDTDHPTLVAVVAGAADIAGAGVALHVPAGQAASITGTDKFQGGLAPLVRDAFLTASLAKIAPAPSGPAIPAVVSAMTGCSALAAAGTWQPTPQYGTVWYPHVAAGWRPYRDGHWAWVAPWGWTWVDDASWGFAPFHYGRWVEINDAWAWTPDPYAAAGPVEYPVYAPALVTFFGLGAAIGAAVGFGAFHNVGWVPLGPGEPYRPWYHTSGGYLGRVNIHNVTNVVNIGRDPGGIDAFRNRGAATVVAASAIEHEQRIGPAAHGLEAGRMGEAHPLNTTFARPASLETRATRPGPAIDPRHVGTVALRAPGPGIGEARPDAAPALRPAEPARVGEAAPRPGEVAARPGEAPRSPERVPEAAARMPEVHYPEAAHAEPGRAEPGHAEAGRAEVGRGEPGRAEPGRAAEARPAARPAAPHVEARPAAPRPAMARPEIHAAARPAAPRAVARAPMHVAAARGPAPAAHAAARPAPHAGRRG